MKTISPSAVIFGPIIAILSEALLLEMTVRLFGRTYFGFISGSMLAMSWNLVQRIGNLLIFYGLNILELYENLISLAKKQLQIQTDILWLPLIFLLIAYCLMGLISAIIGIRIGKKLQMQPKAVRIAPPPVESSGKTNKPGHDFKYSIIWLLSNIILLVASLALLNYAGMIYWGLFITLVSAVWALRYKRALRQLTKPGFWLFFVAITMITSFVFSKVQNQNWQEGMLIGLQMNFRAVVVVLGFSVLGTELYNPVIRSFFLKTSFRQLPAALELSFESLPQMIAHIPDFKTAVRNPVSIINQVLLHGEERLTELKRRSDSMPKVSLICGAVGSGKSTYVQTVANLLTERRLRVGGILSLRLTKNDETTGYDLLDLSTNVTEKFLRFGKVPGKEQIGRFSIFPEGIEKGIRTLESATHDKFDLVIVDEVGRLELRGDGWSDILKKLIEMPETPLLITVREGLEQEIIDKWDISDYEIVKVEVTDPLRLAERISRALLI
jgi:nucleoside-triphosphatase THEP1